MAKSNVNSFKFWCQKVLPLVYDDSLSYYEVLCKVVDYLNKIIGGADGIIDGIEELRADIAEVQKWIDNFDSTYAEFIIKECLATMIFVEISDAGYIVYYIPDTWDNITFNTTGLDVVIPGVEDNRLVLSY